MTRPPAIYVVNLASATERRERMQRRLAAQGLDERATFVEAFKAPPNDDTYEWMKAAAQHSFSTHIVCMQKLLEEVPEEEGGALLVEDDIMFRDDFAADLASVLENVPDESKVLLVGYLAEGRTPGLEWAGREPGRRNLVNVVPGQTWGAFCYWVTHDWARHIIAKFGDTPRDQLEHVVEWELTQAAEAKGVSAYPPLILEEAISSQIRDASEMDYHVTAQAAWPYEDYASAEPDPPLSPLAWMGISSAVGDVLAGFEVGAVELSGLEMQPVIRAGADGLVVEEEKADPPPVGECRGDWGAIAVRSSRAWNSDVTATVHRVCLEPPGQPPVWSPPFRVAGAADERCTSIACDGELVGIAFLVEPGVGGIAVGPLASLA